MSEELTWEKFNEWIDELFDNPRDSKLLYIAGSPRVMEKVKRYLSNADRQGLKEKKRRAWKMKAVKVMMFG